LYISRRGTSFNTENSFSLWGIDISYCFLSKILGSAVKVKWRDLYCNKRLEKTP